MSVIVRACLVAASLAVLGSCQSPEASADLAVTPIVAESVTRYRKEYLVVAGDQLDVVVRGHPQVSRQLIVRPDGFISVPLLDDVKAAGLTFPQLDAKLTELLAYRVVEPEVTVISLTNREPMVYVLGEIPNPSPVPYRLATTAAQAIAHVGGLKHSAAKDKVVLIRLLDEGYLRAYTIPVDVEGQPGPYMALHATLLEPDDILLVPETGIAQFGRWVDDYINKPLSGINSVLWPATNFLLIQDLIED